MKSGYESTYTAIKGRLAGCDLAEAAARLGFEPPQNGVIQAHFLGTDYHISADGIETAKGGYSDPAARSVLVYYITSSGSGSPAYAYSLPGRFIDGVFAGADISWISGALVRKYGDHYKSFDEPLQKLGAIFQGEQKPGTYCWLYTPLPKIPVQIIYYEADDEFPCQIKIMLDNGAGRFFEFEQIAFLCGCLVQAILSV